jgi:formylglycine-generating enzyme required for sulfatase activity
LGIAFGSAGGAGNTNAMTYDLFISHSSADAETAQALVTDFENRNISCWMAPRDIPMGSSYHEEIVQAIENSRAMLLLFSNAANKSEHVLREVELAAQGKKPILPLRIDVSEPAGGLKYMLANKQWVERKALGNRLVDTIEQLLAGARPPRAAEKIERPAPEPPKKPARMSPVMIAAAAAACLVLAAAALQVGWLGKAPGTAQVAPQAKTAPAAPEPQVAVIAPVQPPPAAPAVQPPTASETKAPDPPATGQPPAAPPVQEASRPVEPVSLPVAGAADPDILNHAPDLGEAVPGKTFFRECDMCPVMAVVPAGSNQIGSPGHESGRSQNESPQQDIVIRPAFAVARSEIAFEEWLACVAEGGCNGYRPGDHEWGYGKQPAMNISWNDAQAYVEWLSRKTKARYRLLSEAEWEYAARGCAKVCQSLPFWFGIEISKDRANYDWRFAYLGSPKATARRRTVPIDAGEPNPFGLLHVHGNVREWVADCWNESLAGVPRDASPRTTGDCSRRVVRGGSWDDEPKDLRSAKRGWELATERRSQIGFRVARALKL